MYGLWETIKGKKHVHEGEWVGMYCGSLGDVRVCKCSTEFQLRKDEAAMSL